MRTVFAYLVCGLVLVGGVNHGWAQQRTVFFPSNMLPPPRSMFISAPPVQARYANGVIVSNIMQRAFTDSAPPPPLGTSATRTFNAEFDFDISFDGGARFVRAMGSAMVTVNVQAVGVGGGQQLYNTEILRMDVSGGTLPTGTQIRAGRTKHSTGQTTISPISGGFLISSFFDVFTELSLDGGQTWSPSAQASHVELRGDPAVVPLVPDHTAVVPPPTGVFISPTQSSVAFASGIIIKDVQSKFFSQSMDLLGPGVGTNRFTEQFNSMASFQFSMDGGRSFSPMQVPAAMSVSLQMANPGPPKLFDTEMTQLDISIVGLPVVVMIRESPTLGSYGETAVQQMADGSVRLNSFFDIFTELSLDGGQTWQPATNGPTHVDLLRVGLLSKFLTPNLPPTNGQFNFPGVIQFAGGVLISGITNRGFVPSLPPPPPGQSQLQEFNSTVSLRVSTDGGQTFTPASAPATGMLVISNTSPAGAAGAHYFNTELQQLNIAGGTLPGGMMIRESPSKASLGRTSTAPEPGSGGGYRISSFFDIFTELSLNGGQTWNPALSPAAVVALNPFLPYAPYVITCPSNITVYASTPKGAVVYYTIPPIVIFPDCPFCCFAATGSPPSGSLFPIGTTTVQCMGSDGCGEHPTCTFTVTVLQPLIYAGLVESAVGNALISHVDVGTNQYLTVSNLISSDSDGFHLYLGAVDAARLDFQPTPLNILTDWVVIATAPYGGDSNHVMGTGTSAGGSNPMIRADFSSIGASSVIVEVRDDDNHLISSNKVPNNALVSVNGLFPPPCANINTTTYSYWQSPDHICYRFCKFGCNCLGTNCYVERIACLRPDIAVHPGTFLSDLQFTGQTTGGVGMVTFQGESVGMFGLMHASRGQATFESHPGILMLNNLGSRGEDGVSLDLGNVGQFDMMLAPTMLENQGVCWQMAASGKFHDMENAPLGSAMLVHSVGPGGGCQVSDDFSPVGSSQTRVEIYSGGQLMGSVTSSNGFLGTLPNHGNLIGCGMLLRPLPGFKVTFDSSFIFIPAIGSPQFSGDELHILAAGPGGQVQSLSQFSVQSCGIGQFAILGETVQPAITGILKRSDGSFEIDGQGAAGMNYRLEGASSLGTPINWQPITSTMSSVDGTFHLIDSNSGRQMFYHVVTP